MASTAAGARTCRRPGVDGAECVVSTFAAVIRFHGVVIVMEWGEAGRMRVEDGNVMGYIMVSVMVKGMVG